MENFFARRRCGVRENEFTLKKSLRIGLCGLLAGIVIAGIAFYLRPPSEPVYQGKRLNTWGTLRYTGNRAEQVQAHHALLQIGPKALPFLLAEIRARDSRLLKINKAPAKEVRQRQALAIFQILGPVAKPAIPSLLGLLAQTEMDGVAAEALAAIGPEGVAALARTLDSQNKWARFLAVRALRKTGGASVPIAGPALLRSLKDSAPEVRADAALSLSRLHFNPPATIPALLPNLGDTSAWVRTLTASALGSYGPDAKAAVPSLLKLLNDSDAEVAAAAQGALSRIAPESAPQPSSK